MTHMHRLFIVPIILFFAFADCNAYAAQEIGTASKVVRDVFRKTLDKKLNQGDGLVFNEVVVTGIKSAVDISLNDESTLILGETSEMILDNLVYRPNKGVVEGQMELIHGLFRFASADVKMDMVITTPTATIGIRGTKFDVLADQDTMEVAVLEGAIEVDSAAGTQRVTAGEVYSVSSDGISSLGTQPSAALEKAVTTVMAALATEGKSPSNSPQSTQQASVNPSASPARAETDKENTIYMDVPAGRVEIKMLPDLAPNHVKRIKQLARDGFYDNLTFHFVRQNYVAETGDPTGTGVGGSGVTLDAEFSDTPIERGIVGMSRKLNDPNSGDSIFFIALGRANALDGKYTVWGKVVSGMAYLDQLATGKPPKTPDFIRSLRVAVDINP